MDQDDPNRVAETIPFRWPASLKTTSIRDKSEKLKNLVYQIVKTIKGVSHEDVSVNSFINDAITYYADYLMKSDDVEEMVKKALEVRNDRAKIELRKEEAHPGSEIGGNQIPDDNDEG